MSIQDLGVQNDYKVCCGNFNLSNMPFKNYLLTCDDTGGDATWLPLTLTVDPNITAHAGGGQGSAYPLFAGFSNITVVATTADSVILPNSPGTLVGRSMTIKNNGANSCNVFPPVGQNINALSTNAAYALASGATTTIVAITSTNWQSTS